jgi:hypothetical protein
MRAPKFRDSKRKRASVPELSEPKWTSSVVESRLRKVIVPKIKILGFRKSGYFYVLDTTNGPQGVHFLVFASYGAAMRIGMSFRASPFPEMKKVLSAYFRAPISEHVRFQEFPILDLRIQSPEPVEFEVRGVEELESCLPIVLEQLDRGLRFLQQTESIAGLDALLNSPEGIKDFPAARQQALLAAYLNSNPKFHELANQVMQLSDEWMAKDHDLQDHWVAESIRANQGMRLFVDDLRNGVLRDYERDGEHPLLLPEFDLNAWREARAQNVNWVAIQGDFSDNTVNSGMASEADDNLPIGFAYETVQLSGFDSDGEPSIRVYPEGHYMVVFEFMPPSAWEMDASDEGMLGTRMAEAIGLDLIEEQPGFFLVAHPAPDTIERIRNFVANYRQSHGYSS